MNCFSIWHFERFSSQFGKWFIRRGSVGVCLAIALAFIPTPSWADSSEKAFLQLLDTLPSGLKTTLNACAKNKHVNLAAGADEDGSVICNDGRRDYPAQYEAYLTANGDLLAAEILLAIRQLVQEGALSLEEISAVLSQPGEAEKLRQEMVGDIKAAINAALGHEKPTPKITQRLTKQAMQQVMPMLQSPTRLQNLFGSGNQYAQVVENFCTPAGVSVSQAKWLIPGLIPAQLYAICAQEANLVEAWLGD